MIDVFLKPLESIVNILISRHEHKEDKEQKIDADRQLALDTLFIALTNTVAYTETLPAGQNREKELDLSHRWYAAMALCRPFFDDDHVYWMWHKSLYWLKDHDMSEEELKRLKIDLPTVREKIGEMVWWSDVKKHVKPQSGHPQDGN